MLRVYRLIHLLLIVLLLQKLQTTEKQLKEKCKIIAEQQQELEKLNEYFTQGRRVSYHGNEPEAV